MEGPSAKKSTSLETLVIQNISNASDLKAKLNDIISAGKSYEYDVSSCLKTLLHSSDEAIVLLTVQAISELVKCEDKRETYAQKDIILPILSLLDKVTSDKIELIKQSCRSLGNLCCDCDSARNIILENNGVKILRKLLEATLANNSTNLNEIKILVDKTILNYAIGGQQYTESLVQEGVIDTQCKILVSELLKNDMEDDVIYTPLLILSVINDNTPEFLFHEDVNKAVLNVLKETTNVEISELCLEHLHNQAEHDSVKTLLAKEDGVQLVCVRLEHLVQRHEAGDMNADDAEVEAVMKQACDLIIIVLTGDEAMHILYNKGVGEVYLTMVKWLDSPNYNLLTTAILAIGNFARQDDYCIQMMEDKIFDKLLDIFELYHGFSVRMAADPHAPQPLEAGTVRKLQHAALAALRNLTVPAANKRAAAARGRAAPLLLRALPAVADHHVAYKLLAAIRMLVDGQEGVARSVASCPAALRAAARWGGAEHAGAAGEAPRLLAWAVRHARRCWATLVQVEGCVSSLVNMLVASHSVMQNEAILALTLLSIESLTKRTEQDVDYENSLVTQLIKSEIGKHVSVLIETNCAKMPVEVAENLMAFLDITGKNNKLAVDYKQAKVPEALKKFAESRKDFNEDLRKCIHGVISTIIDHSKE
ncbi:GTPase-GDP dissociation stimulator vimar [Epargyreus clarus]|uniref:GTPase-GDP dissociation stimulator vimar n=1 Tax=Epargyreus clarus TaxID=520877 RepID=UPI003C2FD6D3